MFGRRGDRFMYTLWRRSEYVVGFPVRELRSTSLKGSRGRGSSLTPEQVQRVVDAVIASK